LGLPVYSIENFSRESIDEVVILLSFFHKKTVDTVTQKLTNEYPSIDRKKILPLSPLLSQINDEEFLRIFYMVCFSKDLNLENPKTYTEKMQWLKLYDRRPIYNKLADKYEVRNYVSEKIGDDYLIPSLGCWEHFDDIAFKSLPEQFVLKCTHDSDSIVICTSKRKQLFYDKYWNEISGIKAVDEKISTALKQNWYLLAREWVYKDIKPRIIADKYLGRNISDYRFFVFNGMLRVIWVDFDTAGSRKANIYSSDWELLPCSWTYPSDQTKIIEKPKLFDKMKEFAERLADDLPMLRIDFFLVDEKLYFGETGFYSGSGFDGFTPPEYDEIIGSLLQLPAKGET